MAQTMTHGVAIAFGGSRGGLGALNATSS